MCEGYVLSVGHGSVCTRVLAYGWNGRGELVYTEVVCSWSVCLLTFCNLSSARLLIITGWRVNIVQAMKTILTHIKEVSVSALGVGNVTNVE